MNFEQRKQEWISAVGRLMLAFGEIEHRFCRGLATLPGVHIPQHIVNLKLHQRLDLLEEIIAPHAAHLAEATQLIQSIRENCGVRNLVAHNALYFILNDRDPSQDDYGIVRLVGKSDPLRLESVQRCAAQAEDIVRIIDSRLENVRLQLAQSGST